MNTIMNALNRPWAIRPVCLDDLLAKHAAAFSGMEEKSIETWASRQPAPTSKDILSISGGVATIKIHGVITKTPMLIGWDEWSVGADIVEEAVRAAMKRSGVDSILLDIDSPGGSVDGTPELAAEIFAARGKKPVVAFANGMMASAAYWIGSAADTIVATEAALVGSIGVVMDHYDLSEFYSKIGMKKTPITAGKYKRITSEEKPLSDEGRAYLQEMVDGIYSMFIDAISAHRTVSVEKALAMADGKEFIGKQAHTVGLIDSIGSRERALVITKERSFRNMDLKTLQENHADLYAQVIAMGVEQGKQEVEKAVAEARQTGATAERERITSLLDAGADPQVTREAITEGVTAGEAYKKFFEAEKNKRTTALAGMAASATKPVEPEQPAAVSGDAVKAYEAETSRLMGEGKTRAQAVAAIAASNPGLHDKYLQAINKKGA